MVFSKLLIYTDGGSRGNPGQAAIGAVIKEDTGETIQELSEKIGETTNNVAEYEAVLRALNYLYTANIKTASISFFLDSRLVVEQLSGNFKIKAGHLKDLFVKAKALEQKIGGKIIYTHIPRGENYRADELVNQALDKK